MAKIVFFCRVPMELLNTVEFYKQDIDALRELGHDVVVANRIWNIPLSFDILFVWWWTRAAFPVFLSRLLGRTSIVTGTFNFRYPRHYDGVDYFSRPFWQRALIRYAVRNADRNIFVSQHELQLCEDYFGLDNACYCPHVLHKDYIQGPGSKRELSILNISWSGRKNLKRKGVPTIIEAISVLKKRGRPVVTYLAGHEGDGLAWLQRLIDEYGVKEHVELLGELSRAEKISKLRSCEIYVQPSHFEGFGLAQAEAMGCGACVITCRVGAVEEVVGNAGIYVEPGDAVGLAEAIEDVVADRELRKQLQELAVKRARDAFSAGTKIKEFQKIIGEVKHEAL